MYQVSTLYVSKYWYQVFAVPSWPTPGDIEVKVPDLEFFSECYYKSISLERVNESS